MADAPMKNRWVTDIARILATFPYAILTAVIVVGPVWRRICALIASAMMNQVCIIFRLSLDIYNLV